MLKTSDVQVEFKELLERSGVKPSALPESVIDRVRRELEGEAKASAKATRKRVKVPKTKDPYIAKAVDAFLNTDTTKQRFGQYFIDGHELYFRAYSKRNGLEQNLIAVKVQQDGETVVIGNSSALSLIGGRWAYGRFQENRGETEVQRTLSALVPMIPFNVFEEANLDLATFRVVARGPEETVRRKRQKGHDKEFKPIFVVEDVHFTGASLFTVSEGETLRYYLFDVDRRELEHEIFNAFLVELPVPVTSIEEAYDTLKPEAVKRAEAEGLKVRRQGEFFFIPVNALQAQRLDQLEENIKSLELRTGPNRPNRGRGVQIYKGENAELKGKPVPDLGWRTKTPEATVELYRHVDDLAEASEYFFTGKVEHTGREHAALILKGWYVAVPNTAQKSFTVTGDVD